MGILNQARGPRPTAQGSGSGEEGTGSAEHGLRPLRSVGLGRLPFFPTPSPLFYLRHFSRGLWLSFLVLCSYTTRKRLLRRLFTSFHFPDSGLYQCRMVLIFVLIYFEWRDTENQQYSHEILILGHYFVCWKEYLKRHKEELKLTKLF